MTATHYKARFGKFILKILDAFLIVTLFVWMVGYSKSGRIFALDFFSPVELSTWHFLMILILALLVNAIFARMSMYNFRQVGGWTNHLVQVVMASSALAGILIIFADILDTNRLDGKFSFIFWFSTVCLFSLYRMFAATIVYWARKRQRNIRNVVIVGINPRSLALSKTLENPELGYKIVGFVDKESDPKVQSERLEWPFLCDLSEIEQAISNRPIDAVLIALPIRSYYDKIVEIIKLCAVQGLESRIITDIFDVPSRIRQGTDLTSETTFISYDVDVHTQFQYTLKRGFDLLVSSIAIILFWPLFLLIASAIWLSDGRPVFFVQKRIGVNKRHFNMLKFRTMVRNAEQIQSELEKMNEADGPVFKIKNDPRITTVGRFLRRTSLDEIPQFFNVFVGSMSVIGPRPLPLRDFELFYQNDHRRRFSVKPGITGLWQVGGRDETDFEEWMRLDLEYVDNWSLTLDIRIFIKTFMAVLSKKGAY